MSSQPTDKNQPDTYPETPTSTKRKIAIPNAPKKKKSRRNNTENPQIMFDEWFNQFREMNSKYTNVDLSLHASQSGKPNNFLMLSQKPIKSGSKSNALLIHYNLIPTMLEQLYKLYFDLCVKNGIIKSEKDGKLIVDEWDLDVPHSKFRRVLADFYAKSMVARYSDTSKEQCEGCEYDAPSQRHHDCLMMPLQNRIEILFERLIEKVNKNDINEMAIEIMHEEGDEMNKVPILKDNLIKDEEWVERVKELMYKSLSC